MFDAFGLKPFAQIRIPRLAAPPPKAAQAKTGKSWVQVLRSAPAEMLGDEAKAEGTGTAGKAVKHAQNDCLKAMLTAIHGAQKFIYIEGQFFQSAYGTDQVGGTKDAASGPMAALTDITSLPGYGKFAKQLGIQGLDSDQIPGAIQVSQIDDIKRTSDGAAFLRDIESVLKNVAAIKISRQMGRAQERIVNPIGEALARRIENAIYDGQPFHLYMVLPVHPEGTLNTLNIMTQLHLTMQSLIFGSDSLVNRVRRAILVARLRKNNHIERAEAIKLVSAYEIKEVVREGGDAWRKHITLLNLRSWHMLEKRPVTEQIYVHSKLLIADDRVAVLGSANINDRSQLGDRDSELAVIVRDDEHMTVKLDGLHQDFVSASVHQLRVRLWKKLFGLMGSSEPAQELAGVVNSPAAQQTWELIQTVANSNALAYRKAFPFLADVDERPSSIWPTWVRQTRSLKSYMPFSERFWRRKEITDESLSWEAKGHSVESTPSNIKGFIVALPTSWTMGENNSSGMNLTLLANNQTLHDDDQQIA